MQMRRPLSLLDMSTHIMLRKYVPPYSELLTSRWKQTNLYWSPIHLRFSLVHFDRLEYLGLVIAPLYRECTMLSETVKLHFKSEIIQISGILPMSTTLLTLMY